MEAFFVFCMGESKVSAGPKMKRSKGEREIGQAERESEGKWAKRIKVKEIIARSENKERIKMSS